jgi:hypothetical protein
MASKMARLKEKQRYWLVDSLWVCFFNLRPLRLCERNMREEYVRVVRSDTNAPLRGIKNISEYRRTGPTLCLEKRAQAQMSVDKELLEYCANFARVTPRVTPLPKGCMWYPPPYCARSSLVRGYPCVCPFGALTYLLRKNILLIGLVGAFHALFTAPTGLKHGYPRSSDDRSADRG